MFHQHADDDHSPHSTYTSNSGGGRGSAGSGRQQPRPTPPLRSASGRGFRRGSTWREANANGPPRRMEVSIPQKSLKVFAQAVQCLMKVGKELFIETTTDQLILRTLNDAKSAFAAFYFNDAGGFFEKFRCEPSRQGRGGGIATQESGFDEDNTQASSETGGGGAVSVSCKVLVRAVHSILRTLKKVVRLVIYVEGEDDDHIEPHLVFQMYCEFGYRKVHRFSLQDCEIMHAVFEGEGAARLSCPPVQLSQLLEHIHGTAEVAVGASHDILTVRSYHHPLSGSVERAVLKTEMSISTAEFDTYRFCGADDEEVELVFSLKEIKALLHFSEATEAQTLEMLFREGGDPLLFQSSSNTFAAELIMATMEPKVVRKEPAAAAATGGVKREAGAGSVEGGGGGGGGGRGGVEEERGGGDEEGGGYPQESDAPFVEGSQGGGGRGREDRRDGDVGAWEGADEGTGAEDGKGLKTRRTPTSHDQQRFEKDPFGKSSPESAPVAPAAAPSAAPAAPAAVSDGERDRARWEKSPPPPPPQQQRQQLQIGSCENGQSGEIGGSASGGGRRRRRRNSGSSGSGSTTDDGAGEGDDRGRQRHHHGHLQQGLDEEGEVEGGREHDDIPGTEAQRDSELPTQFRGVRDAFESQLPTQFPGMRGAFDSADSGEDGNGGPVQGGSNKRRRRIVHEEEEEER